MGNDWIRTTKDKIEFRLDRARGMIESIDMLKDYFKKGVWEIVVGVKQRALNCLNWKLEDAQMFHNEMNRVYEMGYKAGKGEPNATAQQCVEILSKMRVNTQGREHIYRIEKQNEGNDAQRWYDKGQNDTVDEAISAIKKQFGIKE